MSGYGQRGGLVSIPTEEPIDDTSIVDGELKLPAALESVLSFKDRREEEIEADDSEVELTTLPDSGVQSQHEAASDDAAAEETMKSRDEKQFMHRLKQNRKKKERRKNAKKVKKTEVKKEMPPVEDVADADGELVEVVYVPDDIDKSGAAYRELRRVLDTFKMEAGDGDAAGVDETPISNEPSQEELWQSINKVKEQIMAPKAKGAALFLEEAVKDDEKDADSGKMSKKKWKKLNRLTVAQLKQLVSRPDVVEFHDVNAPDPKLLVHLKSTKNSVPVPRHWCAKRKYLQGKRGFEKGAFQLPSFIKMTGIMEMREAVADTSSLKSKMKERMKPKIGKIDIDYQKLHDAFFKYQTKPKMYGHGDLYYEGKEFEVKMKDLKPGVLSDTLRTALGMPLGANQEKFPPPWIIAMQRYGPPPSYPNLKIPGLNAPIPEGCSFGYHAGGWGKPPVDEYGRPLYGDVFAQSINREHEESLIDKRRWGEFESDEEAEESEEEEEEDEADETGGLVTPAGGLVTPSGTVSTATGLETPGEIELRKKGVASVATSEEGGGETPALYQVVPEKANTVGQNLMGSSHVYDVHNTRRGEIDIALDADELQMEPTQLEAHLERKMRETEDTSSSTGGRASERKRAKRSDSSKDSKKYKQFKF